MSSPEEKEEVPDQQRNSVFGNRVVRPQTPHFLPEDAEPQELAEYHSTDTLCLSRTKLEHVSRSILENRTLKVSFDFTVHLSTSTHPAAYSMLQWLHAKKNSTSSTKTFGQQCNICIRYSSALSIHSNYSLCHLQYLYLEGNQISSIPDSLFIRLPNLQWLDLRNNQIVSLPAEIGLHR